VALAAALETCIREVGLRYGPVAVRNEIFRLQDVFLAALDRRRYAPQVFPKANRCGILALVCDQDPKQVAKGLMARGIVCSARGGYLRVAPHVENTDEQMEEAAEALNAFEAP